MWLAQNCPLCRTWIWLCRTWRNTNQLLPSCARGWKKCSRILIMLSHHFNVVQKDCQAGSVSVLPWTSDTWCSCLAINQPILPAWNSCPPDPQWALGTALPTPQSSYFSTCRMVLTPGHTKSLPLSEHLFPSLRLYTQSQKQASFSHHKLKLQQSLCRCEYSYFLYISVI